MNRTCAPKRIAPVALIALATGLGLAACGDDDNGAGAEGADTETVSVESIGATGEVLVNPNGAALYTPDQEAGGQILCTGGCTSIWVPVTVGKGQTPSGPSAIDPDLATVKRPDGTTQVTFDGDPLYSFSEEGPGEVTGDGFEDVFNGQQFTWQVVSPQGASSESSDPSSSGSGGGYSY